MASASRRTRLGGAALLLALAWRAEEARGEPAPVDIIVVKRADVPAYQVATEEFAEACRVRARVVQLDGAPLHFRPTDIVLAVGQQALDAVRGTEARVVAALALDVPPGVLAADAVPPPEHSLRALKAARPSVRRVGVVYGPHTTTLFLKMMEPARGLGLSLVPMPAHDGPQAVRELFHHVKDIDAVWLAPDAAVITPQLFRYALTVQLRDRLPVVAVTRQQVKAGALLAVDADARAVGRQAAQLVNELLSGTPAAALAGAERTGTLELTVNAHAARRLGADERALLAMGAREE